MRVRLGDTRCHLNADTRRSGVEALLKIVDEDGPVFSVIANRSGRKINRVAVGAAQEPVKRLYLYTDQPQLAPKDL